jgi:DNA-binding MarR family transcriptional regulator
MDDNNDALSRDEYRDLLNACGCFSLRKASRVVTQLFDEALQPHGIRATQLPVVVGAVALDCPSLSELAEYLVVSPSTLSRNIRPLERDGFIRIKHHGHRTKLVLVTEKGHALLKDCIPVWQRAQNDFLRLIGDETWGTMRQQLDEAVSASRA